MKRYEKATIMVLTKQTYTIEAMFNPEEYSLTQEAKYCNEDNGQPIFLRQQVQPFTVTLFFDTYDFKRDVRDYTDQIAQLTHPTEPGKDGMQTPKCIFKWGTLSYEGRVQKVEQKFTMFLQDGTPVRANVTITLTPAFIRKQVEQMLGIEACRKLWTVKSGDRLDLIAHQALKDASQWRQIASANQIVDPKSFPTRQDIGRVLVIPD